MDDDRILATPTMTCKGRMTEDLIAITDLEGRALNDRRASSELAMHLLIYRERPDVKAVCHAHPPHGTAFAVAGLPIDFDTRLRPVGCLRNSFNRRADA
jgi:L-fuculose-phosphate aldolase